MDSFSNPPVIGITTLGRSPTGEFCLLADYVDAIYQAGGLPVLLPPGKIYHEAIIHQVDGLVFTGGGDIEPKCYRGVSHPEIYKVDSERDTAELALAAAALRSNVAILGICRGLQVLSVASGAALFSHLPDVVGMAIAHREEQRRPTRHWVNVIQDSQLARIVETSTMEIVSWHHQAVTAPPKGWRIAAYAPDGVIEALEHECHPWAITLQWHPEMSPHDPLQQRIFKSFVTAAHTQRVVRQSCNSKATRCA